MAAIYIECYKGAGYVRNLSDDDDVQAELEKAIMENPLESVH